VIILKQVCLQMYTKYEPNPH